MLNTRTLASTALIGLSILAGPAFAQDAAPAPAAPSAPVAPTLSLPPVDGLATDKQKVSYMIGLSMAPQFKAIADYIDPATLAKAIQAGLSGQGKQMTDEQAQQIAIAFSQFAQAREMQRRAEEGAKNLAEGEAFLAANKGKPGVRTTESGLQYQVVRSGAGPRPTAADTVSVHYRGTLLDGKEFDSSYARREPATFPLSGVIPGWTEGLSLMPVGSKYVFWIPAALAYGEGGAGNDIPSNAVLKFEVELIGIVGAQQSTPAQ